mmetsp:Transcript_8802/g.15477  ORF Transcript_8802/g.15477 Transcript_8802/m.15477 type:complete len:116 (-) Transcript_8802:62-409(-)
MSTNDAHIEVEAVEVHGHTGVLVVEACLLVLVEEVPYLALPAEDQMELDGHIAAAAGVAFLQMKVAGVEVGSVDYILGSALVDPSFHQMEAQGGALVDPNLHKPVHDAETFGKQE